jgi:hypothetical protein
LIIRHIIFSFFSDINTKFSNIWPNITKKRENDVPDDQAKWREVKDKLKYFSEKPGKGD